jgi:hypothetical protein
VILCAVRAYIALVWALAVFDAHADAMGMGSDNASRVVLQRSDNLLAFFLDASRAGTKTLL